MPGRTACTHRRAAPGARPDSLFGCTSSPRWRSSSGSSPNGRTSRPNSRACTRARRNGGAIERCAEWQFRGARPIKSSRLRVSCERDGERSERSQRARMHANARWTKPSRQPGTAVANRAFSRRTRTEGKPSGTPRRGALKSERRHLYSRDRCRNHPTLEGLGLTACPTHASTTANRDEMSTGAPTRVVPRPYRTPPGKQACVFGCREAASSKGQGIRELAEQKRG